VEEYSLCNIFVAVTSTNGTCLETAVLAKYYIGKELEGLKRIYEKANFLGSFV